MLTNLLRHQQKRLSARHAFIFGIDSKPTDAPGRYAVKRRKRAAKAHPAQELLNRSIEADGSPDQIALQRRPRVTPVWSSEPLTYYNNPNTSLGSLGGINGEELNQIRLLPNSSPRALYMQRRSQHLAVVFLHQVRRNLLHRTGGGTVHRNNEAT